MACDRCWRLKARCVFDPIQDEDCAQCRKQDAECVWTRSKKPTPAPNKELVLTLTSVLEIAMNVLIVGLISYVLYLEDRTKEIEQRKVKVLPGINIKREIDNLLDVGPGIGSGQHLFMSNAATTLQTSITRTRDDLTLSTGHSPSLLGSPFASRLLQAIRLTDVTPTSHTSHDDFETDSKWKSYPPDLLPQYYGPSSMELLAENAESYLNRVTGENSHFRSEYWRTPRAESCAYANDDPHIIADLQEDIPPADLLSVLVDGYFDRVNTMLPILHRPLFESQLRDNLHSQDEGFARLLLVICAIGACWCEDPRVVDDQCSAGSSAAYRWFRSASRRGMNAVYRPSLINIQFMVLSSVFLLGRPSALQNVEIDVDDVIETDDLYWAPELGAQPPLSNGGSMQLAALNHSSRLWTIVGQALQTIYASASVKVRIGLGSAQGEEWIARYLNQQLNRWAASVPVNRKLSPGQDSEFNADPCNRNFFAAMLPCDLQDLHLMITLWTGYCYAAIYINRPFITSKISEIATASFHNCRQAARQCARMIHAYYRIPRTFPLQCTIPGIFSSAMVLLIDLIANSHPERLGESTISDATGYNIAENERDLATCLGALESLEKHWHIARRLNDVVRECRTLWSSRLPTSATAASSSTLVSTEPRTYDARTPMSVTQEDPESTRLHAQQPASVSTFAWEQSAVHDPIPSFPDFEIGIPGISDFPFSQEQSMPNPVSVSIEPQNFSHDSTLLSGEWMFNLDDVMVPGSATFDIASLLPEPGHDWNDAMENILRLSEGGSMP
ncbi:hypothetical protein B0J17DRAFT_770600 [Rhizoctonia solani]|nr:hypothetical protein B0J17DRAFT_770600 [Rhizoctonia solani]